MEREIKARKQKKEVGRKRKKEKQSKVEWKKTERG